RCSSSTSGTGPPASPTRRGRPSTRRCRASCPGSRRVGPGSRPGRADRGRGGSAVAASDGCARSVLVTELWSLSAGALVEAYTTGVTTPLEALEACLERIDDVDGSLGAFTHLALDEARTEASRATTELRAGPPRSPMHGVPVGVKEVFEVAGWPHTAGSLAWAGRVGQTDAVAVSRLRAAGAVIVGLTRSHEFAWGATTQHERRGGTRNPWSPDRVPGGSSGGSGAAVAAGMVPLALGSDTGGSVRMPVRLPSEREVLEDFARVQAAEALALHAGPLGTWPAARDLLGSDVRDRLAEADRTAAEQRGAGQGGAGLDASLARLAEVRHAVA